MDRSVLFRMIGESAIIVVSILLALSVDTWLDARDQAAQREGHLAALARDFQQMSERVDASYDSANRSVQSGMRLLRQLQEGADLDPEIAPESLWFLIFYEVFSPSVGAYDALACILHEWINLGGFVGKLAVQSIVIGDCRGWSTHCRVARTLPQ